jgi:hypothetical protein
VVGTCRSRSTQGDGLDSRHLRQLFDQARDELWLVLAAGRQVR